MIEVQVNMFQKSGDGQHSNFFLHTSYTLTVHVLTHEI